MAQLKNILQEVTVSNQGGADYSNLNDAIANIGTIKTFRIETAITITANITFPAGVALIIGSQGSITGAFTLTGNKTVISFEGFNSCINTNIIFAGTYLIDKLYPEQFGAVGDGVTDDTTAINKCHDLARLTETSTVILTRIYKTSALINCTNTHQEWRLNAHIIGTNGTMIMQAKGTAGTYRALGASALEATNRITCALLAAEVVKDDIVNIKSTKEFAIGYPQGELKEVAYVDGNDVVFKDYLHDTYNTSDIASACKCNMAKFSHTGMIKLSMPVNSVDYDTDRTSEGLQMWFINRPHIVAEVTRCATNGIQISDCYEPIVVGHTHYGEMAGLGYGISINGATIRSKIYGNYIGHRCGLNTGGSTTGVPWDINIYDVNAVITVDDDGACFLTHYNTGSISLFNCTANGSGLTELRHAGYTLNGRYNRLNNCRAYNLSRGIFATGSAGSDLEINNFSGINVAYGLVGGIDGPIGNLRVNGFYQKCDTLTEGVLFYLSGSTIARWSFNNIKADNITGVISLNVASGNTYPETLHVKGLTHNCDTGSDKSSVFITHPSIVNVIIEKYASKKVNQIIYTNSQCTGLKALMVSGGIVEDIGNVRMCEVDPLMDLIHLDNLIIKNPSTASSKLIYSANGATTIKITNCHTEGTNMDYLTDVVTGKTFTNFLHQGNDFISLIGAHKTQTPTNTITSGSIGL